MIRHYRPEMRKPWRRRTPDELWLRVLAHIVAAGNAGPGDVLQKSEAVRERLNYARLKRMSGEARRHMLHKVMLAIGTRYVGKSAAGDGKVKAATENFEILEKFGGPNKFFNKVAELKDTLSKAAFISDNLAFYRKKGARDLLIELRMASDCMALDVRIKRILKEIKARVPKAVEKHYEEIEKELIEKVAKPSRLSGGELDRILFRNYGDILVRLTCP